MVGGGWSAEFQLQYSELLWYARSGLCWAQKVYFYNYFCPFSGAILFIGLNFTLVTIIFYKVIFISYYLSILREFLKFSVLWVFCISVVVTNSTDFGARFNFAAAGLASFTYFTFPSAISLHLPVFTLCTYLPVLVFNITSL